MGGSTRTGPEKDRARRRRNSLPVGPLLAGAIIALSLLLALTFWSQGGKGRELLGSLRLAAGLSDVAGLAERVEGALDEAFDALGVDRRRSREEMEARRRGLARWTWRRKELHLSGFPSSVLLERGLRRALARSGAELLSLERGPGGRMVSLRAGLPGAVTHEVEIHWPLARVDPAEAGRSRRPRVAIIVDDLGHQWRPAEELLALDAPLTFAVLPGLAASERIARAAREKRREVLLHLPMEPLGYPWEDPGPGALLQAMGREEWRRRVREALDAVPHAVGVNNHMGSRLTESEEAMEVVLEEVRGRGLFFVDSLTTPRSAASRVGRRLGVPILRRAIFMDNEVEEDAILAALRELIRAAKGAGSAIAIAHPHPATIAALRLGLPELAREGVDLVRVSELLPEGSRLPVAVGAAR
ncbi:MAG: divergent polysaccharide deacetylase family protein [Nitrospinota bacterium]